MVILNRSLDIRIICNFSTQKDIAVVQKYQEIGKMVTDSLFEKLVKDKNGILAYIQTCKYYINWFNFDTQ